MKPERSDTTEPLSLAPLAERMRPRNLDEFVGQQHLLGEGNLLRRIVETGRRASLIFWGPPGSGKTTLARILGHRMGGRFVRLSAVLSGLKEFRDLVKEAEAQPHIPTIFFLDEIHRWSKAQQDALLPYVENGVVTLLGSTTQNPSFEVIPPLLSRTRVLVLKPLDASDVRTVLRNALLDVERGLGGAHLTVDDDALAFLADMSGGDARIALNHLEIAAGVVCSEHGGSRRLNLDMVQTVIQKKALTYDKDGEEHYNLISAFIKSMRGSDPDAAVYWLARMLKAGEDPRFLARRMIILASEDVGNADPRGLQIAVAALHAFECVGLPEGFLPLAHAAIYLASAPKSNAVYTAYSAAADEVDHSGYLPVPLHLRNAPTALMKRLKYGEEYKYDHDFESGYSGQSHLPDALRGRVFYRPRNRGYEKKLGEWLAWLRKPHSAKASL